MTEAIEAVKCALRQSDKGMIVSFVVHPNDDASHLLSMPIGQRVMLAVQPFIESGAETAALHRPAASGPTLPAKSACPTSPTPSGLPPPLPPAAPEGRQQSPGSGDAREAPPTFIMTHDDVLPKRPRTPFHQKPLSQQAAILCRDVAFQLWASAHLEGDPVREPKSCEIWLKRKLGIVSFTELDAGWPGQCSPFRDMVEQFEKSVGRIPA